MATDPNRMKKFMFVNRKAPYGTIYALESLEVVLIAATFDQDVSLVFLDDGVYELRQGPEHQGHRHQEPLADLPRARRLRRREALRRARIDGRPRPDRGRPAGDVEVLSSAEMAELMAEQDVVLSF